MVCHIITEYDKQIAEIVNRYNLYEISLEDAISLLSPMISEINLKSIEISNRFNKKPRKYTTSQFLPQK